MRRLARERRRSVICGRPRYLWREAVIVAGCLRRIDSIPRRALELVFIVDSSISGFTALRPQEGSKTKRNRGQKKTEGSRSRESVSQLPALDIGEIRCHRLSAAGRAVISRLLRFEPLRLALIAFDMWLARCEIVWLDLSWTFVDRGLK